MRREAGYGEHWVAVVGTDEIVVEAVEGPVRYARRLLVNGQVVDEEKSWEGRMIRYLCARVPIDGATRFVEAAFDSSATQKRLCKIFVDEKLVGGDIGEIFLVPEPVLWKRARQGGRARFIVRWGKDFVWLLGVVLVACLLSGDFRSTLGVLVVGVLAIAVVADRIWVAAERQYRVRLRRIVEPAWPGPEPISRLRWLASLVLIGVGIVTLMFSAPVFVIATSEVHSPFRHSLPLLGIPFLFVLAGLALLALAVRLRAPIETPFRARIAPPKEE